MWARASSLVRSRKAVGLNRGLSLVNRQRAMHARSFGTEVPQDDAALGVALRLGFVVFSVSPWSGPRLSREIAAPSIMLSPLEMVVPMTVFPTEEMNARWRPARPAGTFLFSASGHNSRQ